MDYKSMISDRRREAVYLRASRGQHTLATEFEEDANAIETLLAEREAAVEEMHGICSFCTHKKTCQFGNHLRDICVNGSRWQWRGPQKGGGA